eukprot:scpid102842/ scgid23351/ 
MVSAALRAAFGRAPGSGTGWQRACARVCETDRQGVCVATKWWLFVGDISIVARCSSVTFGTRVKATLLCLCNAGCRRNSKHLVQLRPPIFVLLALASGESFRTVWCSVVPCSVYGRYPGHNELADGCVSSSRQPIFVIPCALCRKLGSTRLCRPSCLN